MPRPTPRTPTWRPSSAASPPSAAPRRPPSRSATRSSPSSTTCSNAAPPTRSWAAPSSMSATGPECNTAWSAASKASASGWPWSRSPPRPPPPNGGARLLCKSRRPLTVWQSTHRFTSPLLPVRAWGLFSDQIRVRVRSRGGPQRLGRGSPPRPARHRKQRPGRLSAIAIRPIADRRAFSAGQCSGPASAPRASAGRRALGARAPAAHARRSAAPHLLPRRREQDRPAWHEDDPRSEAHQGRPPWTGIPSSLPAPALSRAAPSR